MIRFKSVTASAQVAADQGRDPMNAEMSAAVGACSKRTYMRASETPAVTIVAA
jgi:hypothetical protein